MFPANTLKSAVFVFCMTLSMLLSAYVYAADEKVVGKEVVDGTDTSANSDSPLPDLFTGTMSYRIPIEVAPGRKGLDPGIVLTYRSTNGNGWVGVGWELEMGAIERSTKGSVNYSGNEFLLRGPGGVTELVEVSNPGDSPRVYRAKIEGSFIKYLNHGTYWEAINKKGVRFSFGSTAFTRLTDPNDSGRIFKWCLDQITDTNNNYVTFSYFKDSGQVYLDKIEYTGNVADTSKPPTNLVQFHREDRTDAETTYITNFAVKTAKRLKTIEVRSNTNDSSVLVRKYVLNYDTGSTTDGTLYSSLTKRSLLGAVKEYGSDGTTSKPPITLGYSVTGTSYSGSWNSQGSLGIAIQPPIDTHPIGMYCIPGKYGVQNDILCSTGTTGWDLQYLFNDLNAIGTPLSWPNGRPTDLTQDALGHQCVTGDFKGEGKNELACNFTNNGDWTMLFPSGVSGQIWAKETWQNAPAVLPITQCFGGDFDGNKKSDFACYSNSTWKMALSTGSSWGNAPVQWSGGPSFTTPTNNCMSGDFNGDGKTDFACNAGNSATWNIFLSNGVSWTSTDWVSSGVTLPSFTSSALNVNCMTGDYNGDGKTDIACYITDTWHVLLSTGNSWDTASFSTGGPSASIPLNLKCLTGDYNGDGRTDISCYTSNGAWSTALSLGYGWNTVLLSGGPSPATSVSKQCFTLDANADGKTDIVCYTGLAPPDSNWEVGTASAPQTDLLTHISNGLGGAISVSYASASWSANLPFAMQLASSVSVSDGNGNTATSNYYYSGGYYNISAKEFRGFNHVKVVGPVTESNERTIAETWFHQGDDIAVDANNPSALTGFMKGKPYRTRISDNAETPHIYSETETAYSTYTTTPYNFSPASQTDTYICDGNAIGACKGSGSARKKRTVLNYDAYGNVTRQDVYGDVNNSTNKLLNMTVTRSFLPNTSAWIVGLPKEESVFKGIGTTDSDKVSQTDYYYDDVANCSIVSAAVHNPPTQGNLTRIIRWFDGGSNPETVMAYDPYGNPLCTKDPNGVDHISSLEADNLLKTFPSSSTNAKSHATTSIYYGVGTVADKGLFGQLKSVTDPNLATTTFEYDALGRTTKTIRPDSFWTRTTYNSFGTVEVQNIYSDDQSGKWVTSYFDGLGRTFRTRKNGPDNKVIVTEVVYDQRGNVKKVSVPYFEGSETPVYRSYSYDLLGRVKQVTNPDGTSTLACYNDLITVLIDENGHRKQETRDPLGRLIKVDEYEINYSSCDATQVITPYATTNYTYDVLGNLTGVTDANQNTTTFNYYTLGRKKDMTDPDMGLWSYSYYPDGTVNTITDAKNQTITYSLDVLNRPTLKHYPTGSGATDVVYNYDETTSTHPKGRLTSMSDGSGSTIYNYDLLGRSTSSIRRVDTTDYTITRAYDVTGRLSTLTYPDNTNVSYLYDNAGNLSEVVGYAEYDEYNALGQPGKVYFGNGIITSYWYYPQNNRLFAMKTDQLQTSLLYRNYSYDNNGKITQINDLVSPSVPLDLGTTSVGYTLDPNRAHAVQTASIGTGRTYLYDTNGNMTSDSQRTFTYTPENMPKAITLNGVMTTFSYDGNGKRIKKSTPTSSTIYIDNLYECTDGYCTKHIYDATGRLAIETGTQTFYHHSDHLGSTAIVTDANGDQVESIAYFPFGEMRQDTSSVYLNHKYTGQELDKETQLYNYNARLYNPEIGRFITADSNVADPANSQTLNRYSYVLNNPMNLVDPSGHVAINIYINSGDGGSNSGGAGAGPNPGLGGGTGTGGDGSGDGSGDIGQDWRDFKNQVENVGRDIGNGFENAGREIGRLFGGIFGGHKQSAPQPERFDYYSSTSATSNTPGFTKGSSSDESGFKLPLINNFIAPSSRAISDAEMAMNFLPIGSVGTITKILRPVVIGENMMDRVIPYATEIGADYYKPVSKISDNWMKNNKVWLNKMIKQGRDIIDIGIDSTRPMRSKYYEMENKLLNDLNYPVRRP